MYTVGKDSLPVQECALEAAELMNETLLWARETPYASGVNFYGEVYEDTSDPERYKVVIYAGSVTSIVIEPPSFSLRVEEAVLQTAACDCPTFNPDDIFNDFGQVIKDAELSRELDEFAGAETIDPHYEALPTLAGTEVTIRFDRLGANIVCGTISGIIS